MTTFGPQTPAGVSLQDLPIVKIDAQPARRIIARLDALLDDIDGVERRVDPDSGPLRDRISRTGDKELRKELRDEGAETSRDLMWAIYAAHELAVELERIYWAVKDRPDPRAPLVTFDD